jgi:hypothetical protein
MGCRSRPDRKGDDVLLLNPKKYKRSHADAESLELVLKTIDFFEGKGLKKNMLAAGELFTLIVYGQLILENSRMYRTDRDVLEQIFTFLVKDYSAFALQMILSHENSAEQEEFFRKMIRKSVKDEQRFQRVWDSVHALKDQYTMNE